jgi:hypothetical protein
MQPYHPPFCFCRFTHTMEAMSRVGILDLPRELRDMIYSYILPDRIQLLSPGSEGSLPSGILLANQQFRLETLHAFSRLLPQTTVVVRREPGDGGHVRPTSLSHNGLRDKIVKLVVRLPFRKRNVRFFSLLRRSEECTDVYIRRLLDSMPALREVTCEVTWEPNHAPTVLLPRTKEHMLEELRRATVGQDDVVGWDVECRIRDATRWKNEWSGVVILMRRS